MKNVHETTCKLIELAENLEIAWETLARCALWYMSEQEVADMAHAEELIIDDEDNE